MRQTQTTKLRTAEEKRPNETRISGHSGGAEQAEQRIDVRAVQTDSSRSL